MTQVAARPPFSCCSSSRSPSPPEHVTDAPYEPVVEVLSPEPGSSPASPASPGDLALALAASAFGALPRPRVRLVGLRLRHASPSVASNYAVACRGTSFSRDGAPGLAPDLELVGCEVASATGSCVGVEGGAVAAAGCRMEGAATHGARALSAVLALLLRAAGCCSPLRSHLSLPTHP